MLLIESVHGNGTHRYEEPRWVDLVTCLACPAESPNLFSLEVSADK